VDFTSLFGVLFPLLLLLLLEQPVTCRGAVAKALPENTT